MKLFDLDGPLIQALNKVADLMILNLLTLACCIPVVTAGASLTAMHYVALKMARNEECYIARDFFKSFRLNFRQGTLIWLLELLIIALLVGDFLILRNMDVAFGGVMKIILQVIALIELFHFTFAFPVLAKFDDTVMRTMKNALIICIAQFPKTIAMIILAAIPAVLFVFAPQITPILFLFGLAVPAWLSAKMYSGYFRLLEAQSAGAASVEIQKEEEEERIFRDELEEESSDAQE